MSHILPEFFYAPTYDSTGRFTSLTRHPRQKRRQFQGGFTERLLCFRCEAQFNEYETYAARLFRELRAEVPAASGRIEVESWDCRSLRLFGLSVLWRAHESRLFNFAQVELGAAAEIIRDMLVNEDPAEPWVFPFALIRVDGPADVDKAIVMPAPETWLGLETYIMQALGFRWRFVVSDRHGCVPPEFPFVGFGGHLQVKVQRMTPHEFLRDITTAIQRSGLH